MVGVFHDVNLALRLTDQVLFMKDGRLIRGGAFAEVASRGFLVELYGMDIAAYMTQSLRTWEKIT